MDPIYVKGLREAKAQVDAGTLTPEEFEKEKKKLLAQREEREKEVSRRAALCAACWAFLVRFFNVVSSATLTGVVVVGPRLVRGQSSDATRAKQVCIR